MSQERPEEEQPQPDDQYEPDVGDDAIVVRQVALAWLWSSLPWLAIAAVIYYLGFFEEITGLLVVLVVVVPRYIAQRRTSYTITDRALIYKRGGIFGVQRVPIPINRLKDVRSRFGLFGKTLGYQTVDVMLDNGAVADLSYVPLGPAVSDRIKELIDAAAEDEEDPQDADGELDAGDEDDGPERRGRS